MSKYVFSICPAGYTHEQPRFHPETRIVIPPCADRSKPVCVEVVDHQQVYSTPVGHGQGLLLIPAADIAKEIVRMMSTNIQGAPGVWMQDGPIVDPEMHQAALRQQSATSMVYYEEATRLYAAGKLAVFAGKLGDTYRKHAAILGLTPEWAKPIGQSGLKACVACSEQIPISAMKCPKCHEITDPARYADHQQAIKRAGLVAQMKPKEQPDAAA